MKVYTDNELLALWHRNCDNEPLTGEELNALRDWDKLDLVIEDEKAAAQEWFTSMPDSEYNAEAKIFIRFNPRDLRDNEFEDFRTKCEFEYVPVRPLARQAELDDFEKQVSVVRVALATVLVVVVLAFVRVLV